MSRSLPCRPTLAPLALALSLAAASLPASAALTASFSAGELTVGADAGESIVFGCEPVGGSADPTGQVLVNGATLGALIPGGVQCGQVSRIVVNADAGDSLIDLSLGGVSVAAYPNISSTLINAGAGDDVVRGSYVADVIVGGPGTDRLAGGSGDDTFVWNPGDGTDTVEGQAGNDQQIVEGGSGADPFVVTPGDGSALGEVTFSRNPGFQIFLFGTEQLTVSGNDGDDTLDASSLPVGLIALELNGGAGNDTIIGSAGDDTIDAGAGNDSVDAGPGTDSIALGDGDDSNVWNPGDGTDSVQGGGGSDRQIVQGGGNADPFFIEPGNGSTTGEVRFFRNPGFEIFLSATEQLAVFGNGGDDTLDASALPAGLIALELDGGDGNDTIIGSAGADQIDAGPGNDTVDGNPGNDSIVLGAGDDLNTWNNGDNSDSVLGGDGDDRQVVNGAPLGDVMAISAGVAPFDVRFARSNLVPFTVDMASVESLEVNGGDGEDSLTTVGLAGVAQFLNGGLPDVAPGDSLAVAGFSGALDSTPVITLSGAAPIAQAGFESAGGQAAPPLAPQVIPTLDLRGLIAAIMLLAVLGLWQVRRRAG